MSVRIVGTGSYVPAEVLSNAALEERLGVEAGWVYPRTGVLERRIAAADEAVSDLALRAAAGAIDASDTDPNEFSLLILATSTPDRLLPPTAPALAHRLGLRIPALDLAASCSGFLYGLALADRWLAAAPADDPASALVIGANVLSRRTRWTDRNTAPLFGDGAGAVVLRRDPGKGGGILAAELDADGNGADHIHIPAGGSLRPLCAEALERGEHLMVMADGAALFRHAVQALTGSARRALAAAAVVVEEVDWFVPHQASGRIVEKSAQLLGVPTSKVVTNLERYGNTSAASIPIALHEAVADGRIEAGDLVLLAAAGAGLTAGAAVVRW